MKRIFVLGVLVAGACLFLWCRYRAESRQLCVPPEVLCRAVRTGDLVFSVGHSLQSDLVRTAGFRCHSEFSHVGFLRRAGDSLHVVHMAIDDGAICEEPLAQFIRRSRVLRIGVYRLREAPDSARLCATLDSLVALHKAFDYEFDRVEDERYYCTELICKALKNSGRDAYAGVSCGQVLYPGELIDEKLLTPIN